MSRIYIVGTPDGDVRLVRAKTKQQALTHIFTHNITIKVANQDELVEALEEGVEVENYKHPDQLDLDLPAV